MSSGGKRVLLNVRERLVSQDHNRLQAMLAAEIAETQRRLTTDLTNWERSTPVFGLPAGVTAPLTGTVLQGLFVIAPLAAVELTVASGMALFVDPDGQPGSTVPSAPNPDDSPGKLCLDPVGVAAGSGVLTFLPNPGPGVRVDVVEVQRDPGVVLETDSRDVFNVALGAFAPATVNKVLVDGIRYRIRRGVGGAGLPANALGWMPIAVVCVPVGAVDFDACTIFDVRPLVSDRVTASGGRTTRRQPEVLHSHFVDSVTAPGSYICDARTEGAEFDGYWSGGEFEINLRNAALREPGFVVVPNQIVYVWALYPGGLPRWARYGSVAVPPFGGRVPEGTRGILCISQTGPAQTEYVGPFPNAPIALPPDSGFDAGTAFFGRLMFATANDGTGACAVTNCDRNRLTFPQLAPAPTILPAVAPAAQTDVVTLAYGTDIPYGARKVLLFLTCTLTAPAGTEFVYFEQASLKHPSGAPFFVNELRRVTQVMPAAGTMTAAFMQWVDLITDYGDVTLGPLAQQVQVNWGQTGGVVKGGEVAAVVGWSL